MGASRGSPRLGRQGGGPTGSRALRTDCWLSAYHVRGTGDTVPALVTVTGEGGEANDVRKYPGFLQLTTDAGGGGAGWGWLTQKSSLTALEAEV